jgi:small GTP-binding protein
MRTETIKSKICLVGDLAVGKTSMIRRYVLNAFDDSYLTTLGTKVSKKVIDVPLPEQNLQLSMDMVIWDIMGQHGFQELLKEAYFFGARGILAVADLTRAETLESLRGWIDCVVSVAGNVPILLAVNKADLQEKAAFGTAEIEQVARDFHCEYLMTSAKLGSNVEESVRGLATLVAKNQLLEAGRLR